MVTKLEIGVGITKVRPRGLGEAKGLLEGDVIERINGEAIRDPIDYRFHIGEESVELEVRRNGALHVLDIQKDADDTLGLELEDLSILKCNNKCVFCFLHQMPKGMRKTLYYQDDDYRLSFVHGAYVTLTNLSDEEFQRIVDQRLSPLYISVHATDPDLRGRLLGRETSVDVMERIGYLSENNIQMHAQVVFCPGWNDGQQLKRTVFDLAGCYPDVASLGVVPLGLTRYRKHLPELAPVTPRIAEQTIEQVSSWQSRLKRRHGRNFVYLGDEFYLMAGRQVPSGIEYDGFPLLENGVGMVRRFCDAFERGFDRLKDGREPLHVLLTTSLLGSRFMREMVDRLNGLGWPRAKLVEVRNRFFGDRITVTGLLTGADMLAALKREWSPPQVVLLPPNCVSHAGLFLDDLTPSDLAQALGAKVVVGSYDLVETLTQIAEGWEVGKNASGGHPYISSHQMDA